MQRRHALWQGNRGLFCLFPDTGKKNVSCLIILCPRYLKSCFGFPVSVFNLNTFLCIEMSQIIVIQSWRRLQRKWLFIRRSLGEDSVTAVAISPFCLSKKDVKTVVKDLSAWSGRNEMQNGRGFLGCCLLSVLLISPRSYNFLLLP